MDIRRILAHWRMTPWRVRRAFPPQALAAVEEAIRTAESGHGGEIRFALEGALDTWALFKGQSARARAIDVFSDLRVWDTEYNNGVLIYLLLADRDVEIVADRGIDARVGHAAWEAICWEMEGAFREGQYERGVIAGIRAVSGKLAEHFPSPASFGGELPDKPVVL